MNVDENLFMYDVVAVTIIRDQAPYIKEWIDYHLLAGVNHFLIYDNDSSDNLQEVLKPYAEKKLVTVMPAPQTHRQLEAYNDAVRNFKYFCRLMAFIDVDEFILPKGGKSIAQVTDEILDAADADGIAINLHNFGSNGIEKADNNVGVLERFTRRAVDDWAPLEGEIPSGNAAVKVIADPRRIKCFTNPHVPKMLDGCKCVNENGVEVTGNFSVPVTADKIVINCYVTKSRAEYAEKVHRRETAKFAKRNEVIGFDANDRNEVVDEEILTYREKLRAEKVPKGDALKYFAEKNRINGGRIFKALVENLMPDFEKKNLKVYFENPKNRTKYFEELIKFYKSAPPGFFDGEFETFLICVNVSLYLKKGYLDGTLGALFEEASLNALCQTFFTRISIVDLRLLIDELPRLVTLPYKAVDSLFVGTHNVFIQFLQTFRTEGEMEKFEELTYLIRMLQTLAAYRRALNGR